MAQANQQSWQPAALYLNYGRRYYGRRALVAVAVAGWAVASVGARIRPKRSEAFLQRSAVVVYQAARDNLAAAGRGAAAVHGRVAGGQLLVRGKPGLSLRFGLDHGGESLPATAHPLVTLILGRVT